MIDEQLFTELQDLYAENLKMFEQQNSGFLIEKIVPLTIEAVAKAIDEDGILIDKRYVFEHYRNFTINPQITELQKGFTTRIEISPDISWEAKK
jgi:hypothetical protein